MNTLRHVAFDLDGILVFPKRADVSIPGRTRPTYIDAEVLDFLVQLGQKCNLSLATARSRQSVFGLTEQAPELELYGLVCECGLDSLRLRDSFQSAAPDPSYRQSLLSQLTERLPGWELISGYRSIIGMLSPARPEEAQAQARQTIAEIGSDWIVHQERHKTFFYPSTPSKLAGLRFIDAHPLWLAAGDDTVYDLEMVQAAKYSLTTRNADAEIRDFVANSPCGTIADGTNHVAAKKIVQAALRIVTEVDE